MFGPGEHDVGDEHIGRGLLHEGLHLGFDEVRRHAYLEGGVVVGGGHEILHAGGEADLGGWEVDQENADAVAGGGGVVEGFVEELGVGGGGDDGDVLAT